jgi:hypothetical protein
MRRWLNFIIGTKASLLILVGVVFAISQAYSLPATDYIRNESQSVVTDVALRLIYFTLMCLVAFSETLLADELFFHGGWRRRVLAGRRKTGQQASEEQEQEQVEDLDREPVEKAEDPSMMASLFRDYTVHVTLVFLALLAGNYFLFNAINGDFDPYYREVGYLYTQLRSPDPEIRKEALAELAPKRVESVSSKLLERLSEGTDAEKTWAAWGLGYRAEYGLLDPALRQEAESRILPLVEEGEGRRKSVAAVALARLESYRWLDDAVRALQDDPDSMLAIALGLLRDHRPEALAALSGMLSREDETEAMAAAWALGQMKVSQAAVPLRKKLEALDGPVQCVAVESLGRLGDAKAVPILTRLFESKESSLICPQKSVMLRPDGEGDRFYLFYWRSPVYSKLRCTSKREPLRVRILKVLWRIGDTKILPWVRKMAESGMLAPRAKACAIRVYNRAVPDE